MTTQKFYVLDADKAWAVRRIAELDAAILNLGPEFEEAFAQSSETWHDNAPFDALRDRQSGLAAERHELKMIINKAALTCPNPALGKVGIGSTVIIQEVSKEQRLFVAGNWSPHIGQVVHGALVVTCESPLGKALYGAKLGQEVALAKPARRFTIKHIE